MIATQRAGLAELARLASAPTGKARELAAIERASRADREQLLKERREHRRVLRAHRGRGPHAGAIAGADADEARLARLVEEIGKCSARPGRRLCPGAAAPARAAAPQGLLFRAAKAGCACRCAGNLRGASALQRSGGDGVSTKGVFIRAPRRASRCARWRQGRVVYADWMRGFGNLLIVDHGEAYLSIYGNNESLLKADRAMRLAPGEPLATVGAERGQRGNGSIL